MPEYTQDDRIIAIDTPLGKDQLLLQSFQGRDGVSQLFHFTCECLSESKTLNFDKVIGSKATITVHPVAGEPKYFNGIVSRFTQGRRDDRFSYFTLELVPHLWALSRTATCRIFQNQTVFDIIAAVLKEYKLDHKNEITGDTPTLDYCVQYRETDLNFVTRLMEQYGLFYFFRHELQRHEMVISNTNAAFKPCPGQASARYHTATGGYYFEEDLLTGMQLAKEVRPGMYTLGDFDFEKPNIDLTVQMGGEDKRKFEIFDYPGEYVTKAEGERIVHCRLEEEEVPTEVIRGSSFCRPFRSGYRFDLKDHYNDEFNKSYVLTEVQHSATVGQNYQTTGGSTESENYINYFTAIPFTRPFRAPRLTPTPIISGPQTAIVVGRSGEEIDVDKYGRVKVQFHWDRAGKYNENSSCWIRVSQLWAGKQWGAMFIPRIGQEVIVEFLEGDPDRPIITGRVYNGESMPPYKLPDEKTKSTIKTYSSKGGGGFNEFRFEDKKGSEQIFLHAEKDNHIRVKSDEFETIGNDRHLIVKGKQYQQVEGDKHFTLKGDHNIKMEGTLSETIGGDFHNKTSTKIAMDAGQEIHLKSGMNLTIETGTNLTLKVGGNFINLSPAGVAIKGTMVLINSGGAAGSGSGAKPEVPKLPKEADTAEPGKKPTLPKPKVPEPVVTYTPQAMALQRAARTGAALCDI